VRVPGRILALPTAAVLLAGCPNGDTDTDDTGDSVIYEGPELVFTPVAGPLDEGTPVPLTVEATDTDGVSEVKVFYRTTGEPAWDTLFLEQEEGTDDWSGTIPGDQVEAPGLLYYLRAADASEYNIVSLMPEEGQQGPYEVPVNVVGRGVPFFENFEGAPSAISLFDYGWAEYSEGFTGYAWDFSEARSVSGEWSVSHRRGLDGLSAMTDWLVSPPLDLSSLGGELQLTWQEWGNYTELAQHSLWISVGSRDPDDGDYVLVADLEPPAEDRWSRTSVVEITDYNDARAAYLGWLYEGQFSDDWFIDDVWVRALAPDIQLTGTAFEPVDPGGETTITLTIENATVEDASGLTVTGIVDTDAGSFGDPVVVGDLAGNASTDAVLTLTVDEAWPDNSYLPFAAEVTDGTDTWRFDDLRIVVGEVSTATFAVNPLGTGLVQGWLGVGDPADPDLEFPVLSDMLSAGETVYDVDLTGLNDYLPPAAGAKRWYLRLLGDTNGAVTALSITHDGLSYVSDDLGSYSTDAEALYYLPRPPLPVVTGTVTSDDPVPDITLTWTVTLQNQGTETVGLTTVTVSSPDPDVVVNTPGPFELDADGWDENAAMDVEVEVEILASQNDSRPVRFDLLVTDEVESFATDAEIAVPWPVLHVTGVRVDDFTHGDNDRRLDPGERAKLDMDLTNVGGEDSFGPVYCTLSQVGGAATATILDNYGAFGPLSMGDTEEETFEVEVTTDNQTAYRAPVILELGEAPWILVSPMDDPPDDAIGGYGFDIVNGRYRVSGSTLQIVLTSATDYDAGTLFIESWMSSPGAFYLYYQLVAQSGVGTLRGYKYSYTTLSHPTVTALDDREVLIEIDLTSMDLSLDRVDAGFAAGFCAGSFFCDHFPDGWGDPYSGLRDYLWVTLDWSN